MCILKNMIGTKFNGSVVETRHGVDKWGQALWECLCSCGNKFTTTGGNIRSGNTKSCGCMKKSFIKEANTTHGDSNTRIYNIWCDMKRRCHSPANYSYEHYGARGISVCEEWGASYEVFKEWSENNGYADNLSIDRIDNDGNYTPDNCRWAGRKVQGRNKRDNRIVDYRGKRMTMAELIETVGMPESTVRYRIKKGIPLDLPRNFNRITK